MFVFSVVRAKSHILTPGPFLLAEGEEPTVGEMMGKRSKETGGHHRSIIFIKIIIIVFVILIFIVILIKITKHILCQEEVGFL